MEDGLIMIGMGTSVRNMIHYVDSWMDDIIESSYSKDFQKIKLLENMKCVGLCIGSIVSST